MFWQMIWIDSLNKQRGIQRVDPDPKEGAIVILIVSQWNGRVETLKHPSDALTVQQALFAVRLVGS